MNKFIAATTAALAALVIAGCGAREPEPTADIVQPGDPRFLTPAGAQGGGGVPAPQQPAEGQAVTPQADP